jgi:glycosyltransferase involved in cell wall biosynthesis
VLPSAIAVDRFPYRPRERLVSPVKILVVGRIKPQKGTKDVVDLAVELMRKGIPTKVKIVGVNQSPEYMEQIWEAIRASGLEAAVEHVPMISQPEVARLYQESDLCFFPTYFKTGFSRVPLEAMASGSLVITYGNEGSSESVRHGETGFLVAPGDMSAAARIVQAMQADHAAYRRILFRAREAVEHDFDMDSYVDKIEAFLRSAVNAYAPLP